MLCFLELFYYCLVFCLHPDGMIISHLPHGPTAYFTLADAVLRHDIPNVGTMSEEYPLVMAYGLTSELGKRVGLTLLELLKCSIYFTISFSLLQHLMNSNKSSQVYFSIVLDVVMGFMHEEYIYEFQNAL